MSTCIQCDFGSKPFQAAIIKRMQKRLGHPVQWDFLWRAIQKLRPSCQGTLFGCLGLGLSSKEIAERENVCVSAVEYRFYVAVEHLTILYGTEAYAHLDSDEVPYQFSGLSWNCLKKLSRALPSKKTPFTLRHLSEMSRSQLFQAPRVGGSTVFQIERVLAKWGLKLQP